MTVVAGKIEHPQHRLRGVSFMRPSWRCVDGVLALDKPVGPSSTSVLQHVRRLYRAQKAGHGGTLDPAASGLLVLLFGEATKFSQWQLGGAKTYTGTIRLGVTTSTDDAEGEVLQRCPVTLEAVDLSALANRFTGTLLQRPPMFSALKREGRPLYAYARKGLAVDIASREVVIERLALSRLGSEQLLFAVDCGSGTYIRSLARDIGEALGCGAHLESLRRTHAGGLDVAKAVSVEALEAATAEERDGLLLPPDALLWELPRVDLQAAAAKALTAGQPVFQETKEQIGFSRVYGPDGDFLGVAEATPSGRLLARRLMAST
jgi:tRNA pseudouridine55 synthase